MSVRKQVATLGLAALWLLVGCSSATPRPGLTDCMAARGSSQLADWQDLGDSLRRDLIERVDADVRRVLADRLRCVKAHYPDLETATFLAGDTDAALQHLGIPAGVASAEPEDPPPLPRGETRILSAPSLPTYTPSPPEVTFATVYVACGTRTKFEVRLRHIVDPAARQLRRAAAARVSRFGDDFEQSLSRLGG